MSDLDRLAKWLEISLDDAMDLLDGLAWVRQQHEIKRRGYSADLPRDEAVLQTDAALAAELLEIAYDFDLSPRLIAALQRRAKTCDVPP